MTPLSAIRGYVETLGMPDLPLDEATRAAAISTIVERGNAQARSDHRRPARSRAARRRRRRRCVHRTRCSSTISSRRVADRHGPTTRERGITLDADGGPGTPLIVGRRRSARAGAPEPRRERDPAHARRRHRHARAPSPTAMASTSRSPTPGPASRRSTCRASSIGSTRSMRRAPAARPVGQRPRPLDRAGDRRAARRRISRGERHRRRRDRSSSAAGRRPRPRRLTATLSSPRRHRRPQAGGTYLHGSTPIPRRLVPRRGRRRSDQVLAIESLTEGGPAPLGRSPAPATIRGASPWPRRFAGGVPGRDCRGGRRARR